MATLDEQVKNSLGMLAPGSPDNVLLRTGADSSPAGREGAFGGGPARRIASGVGDVINNLTETRYSGGAGYGMQSPVPSAQQLGKVDYTPSSATTTPTPQQPSIASVVAPAAKGMGDDAQIEKWRAQDRTEAVKAGMGPISDQPYFNQTKDAAGNSVTTLIGEKTKSAGMGGTQDIEAQIQQLVNNVSSTSSFDELFATKLKAGMLTNVLKEKGELEKANIMGKYGIESAKLRRGELDEIARGNLEAKIAHNKVLENDFNLRLQQQKDIAGQKALAQTLSQFAVHESDPMNPGEKAVNMRSTYFNVWDSGTPVHSDIEPAVKQMGNQYNAYRAETMKLSGKKALTPEEELATKSRFRKSLSMYYTSPAK